MATVLPAKLHKQKSPRLSPRVPIPPPKPIASLKRRLRAPEGPQGPQPSAEAVSQWLSSLEVAYSSMASKSVPTSPRAQTSSDSDAIPHPTQSILQQPNLHPGAYGRTWGAPNLSAQPTRSRRRKGGTAPMPSIDHLRPHHVPYKRSVSPVQQRLPGKFTSPRPILVATRGAQQPVGAQSKAKPKAVITRGTTGIAVASVSSPWGGGGKNETFTFPDVGGGIKEHAPTDPQTLQLQRQKPLWIE